MDDGWTISDASQAVGQAKTDNVSAIANSANGGEPFLSPTDFTGSAPYSYELAVQHVVPLFQDSANGDAIFAADAVEAGLAGFALPGSMTFEGFANNGTLDLTGAVTTVTVDMAAGADTLNLQVDHSGALAVGTVAVEVANVNITVNDSSTQVVNSATVPVTPGTNTDTLTLTDASATHITVAGNANLTLTGDAAATGLVSVDASAMTGGLTYTTVVGAPETVHGGHGTNTIIASNTGDVVYGGAAADQLTALSTGVTLNSGTAGSTLTDSSSGNDTLNGGAGNDTFVVSGAHTGSTIPAHETVIDGAHTSDVITLSGVNATEIGHATVTAYTPTFGALLNAAVVLDGATANQVAWFQYQGNTYIVENAAASETTFGSSDKIVELHGLIDLSTATVVSNSIHIG